MEIRQAGVCLPPSYAESQSGFTLLEVMIVVVIIAVISAVAIPAFSTWHNQQAVRSASQSLLAQLKQARVKALAKNRNVSIEFCDGSVRDAWVFDSTSPDASCDPCSTLACTENMISYSQFSDGLSLSTNKNPITFYSRGTAGNATVTLSSGSSSQSIATNIIGRSYLQ